MNTRSKSGISKPVAPAPASEPPKPKAKKPTPAKPKAKKPTPEKPKTVRFSDGHQSRDSHRQQGASRRRRRSPSPRHDYVQAPPYGMPNVGHGYGLGFYPPPYGYPPYGYSSMGMPPMFSAPIVDRQQFQYGSIKRSRHESTDSEDDSDDVVPVKCNPSKSGECFSGAN